MLFNEEALVKEKLFIKRNLFKIEILLTNVLTSLTYSFMP